MLFALLALLATYLATPLRRCCPKILQVFGVQVLRRYLGILEDWFCKCFCMPRTTAQEVHHAKWVSPCPAGLINVQTDGHDDICSDKLSVVQVLVALPDDLRANVFFFAEVGCVGCCGATCRELHGSIWADRAFWQFYCGPTVNDRIAQPWACPAHALREAFRKWVFHIDGVWSKNLRDFIDQARKSPSGVDLSHMLSYATYVASGLMPYDSRPAVAEFTGLICELLFEYSPERSNERRAAEAITAQVECMGEVFTGAQRKSILSAFDCSLGRVVLAPSELGPDIEPPWRSLVEDNEIGGAAQYAAELVPP